MLLYMVFSSKPSISSEISIKPDMTNNEHKTETLLLKERFILIDQCVERKFIRLRGNSLYVHMVLCKIHNFAVSKSHSSENHSMDTTTDSNTHSGTLIKS